MVGSVAVEDGGDRTRALVAHTRAAQPERAEPAIRSEGAGYGEDGMSEVGMSEVGMSEVGM